MKPITVLLAEDHAVVRQGLRALLEVEPDIQVVGEAETGREAVRQTRKLRPDVVVMDIAMPLLNGLEATRQIRKAAPATRILVLSAHGDDAYVDEMRALGVAGFLLKQTSAQVLTEAVREIHQGHHYYGTSIARRLPSGAPGVPGRASLLRKRDSRLSPREAEVLQLIAEGQANKQVAAELGISVKTVEKHRQSLMDKLRIHDTAGLTRYAITVGMVEANVQVKIL